MREPHVIGDWQECADAHAGLRVRVHGLERVEPPHGRDDAAEGLIYFRFRVTVENRMVNAVGIHLEDGQVDVRTGSDGESAFLDWRNSQFIEGFDLYPLRRATAVLYAAAPESCLHLIDIQVQVKADDEWADRYLWSGDMTATYGLPGTGGARADGLAEHLAGQIGVFLREQAERGRG
ncbi:hypothetical protein NGF19_15410 [Streptomyces sp. RY43-2]|uniref:Uncharacterized protein n=1 Tax=Streptomyces macrolidinus TaxID=2952607 RepID=A0ABT0ZF08_9ACTN|nr:hypothetical protein [Streptomyces macrolidinus]MCN9242161.1 hypothetical protein [Streptomyces macrolidinus]